MRIDPFTDFGFRQRYYVGIGETALDVAGNSFSVHERKIFRVFGVQFARDQGIEGMHKRVIDYCATAVLVVKRIMFAVQSMAVRKIGVPHHFCPKNLAIKKRGYICQIDWAEGKNIRFGN